MQAAQEEKRHFVGLPIPAAGGVLASYIIFVRYLGLYAEKEGVIQNIVHGWYEERVSMMNHVMIPVLLVVLAYLMVSTVKFPALKGSWVRTKISLPVLFLTAVVISLTVLEPQVMIFSGMIVYLLLGVVPHLLVRTFKLGYLGFTNIQRKRGRRE